MNSFGLSDPVVRTFRIPRALYLRVAEARGLESLNGEVVRRLELSFRVGKAAGEVGVSPEWEMVVRDHGASEE